MQLILISGNSAGTAPTAHLRGRHVALIALAVTLLLPALLGVVVYRIDSLASRDRGIPELTAYREHLTQARATHARMRADTTEQLNALATRMGSLQAQVLRLNALGGRLTRIASLDTSDFDFDAPPAMGGPERFVPEVSSSSDVARGLDGLASELSRSEARLVALETLLLDRRLTAAVTPSAWPADGGWISSGFGVRIDPFTGSRSAHEGVDIAARFGGPIYATSDGVVSFAGDKGGYGLTVELTHESGLVTRYAHTSEIIVKEGDRVSKRQLIARVGSSGRSTGPHLHFEVLRNGQAVNPAPYLAQAAAGTRIASTTLPKSP